MVARRVLSVSLVLSLAANATPPHSQSAALHVIYASTGGTQGAWSRGAGWGSDARGVCGWQGVTCDAAGANVVGLDLSTNGLVGTVPDVALTALPALQRLLLSGNLVALGLPVSSASARCGTAR